MSRDRRLDRLNNTRGTEYWTEPPPRWLNCPPIGDIIEGRFLPFKAPLDSRYDAKLPVPNRFSVADVFSAAADLKVEISVWLDLAKTSRFYSKSEVESRGAQYRKLTAGGHDERPTPEQTHLFFDACDKLFVDKPNAVIGIHCTHGYNRTGFMICAYLVEKFDWSLGAALREFAKARPPGIYKQDYLKELYTRYDDPDFEPVPPELPAWCYEDELNAELDDEGNNPQQEDERAPVIAGSSSYMRGGLNTDAKFMDGVTGVVALADLDLVQEIQRRCKALCRWQGGGFPGSQPVSMGLDNLHLIGDAPYRVSWKADGVRYMLFVDGVDRVFFVDRNNCVFHVTGMSFPNSDGTGQLENTLMDGEMILDVQPDKTLRPRFLIYDVVHALEIEIGQMNFDKRCEFITKKIIGPRDHACTLPPPHTLRKDREPFAIRWKQFFHLIAEDPQRGPQYMAEKLLGKKFAASISHEVDGLVFEPVVDPYIAGRCDKVLKWKPPHLCTIDFRLQVVSTGGLGMIPKTTGTLWVNGHNQAFGTLLWRRGGAEMRKYEGKILECKYDAPSNKWEMLRERTDKSFPNAFSTADSVYRGIINPLTQEHLFNYIRRYSYGRPKRHREEDHDADQHFQQPRPPVRPRIEQGHDPSAPKVF
ncbi:mRNA-capping enzyme [Hypsibius exemplaris]|uniref:mRNA-capping enzyme n=1 Tax=Hypsibius exemplaris TaxID=2072580 RepID=A0A1W0XCL6_HYPEX|nr:mRNA-capping enzyme [Hypsibius exemplaris]